jgi:hypothetical protein
LKFIKFMPALRANVFVSWHKRYCNTRTRAGGQERVRHWV